MFTVHSLSLALKNSVSVLARCSTAYIHDLQPKIDRQIWLTMPVSSIRRALTLTIVIVCDKFVRACSFLLLSLWHRQIKVVPVVSLRAFLIWAVLFLISHRWLFLCILIVLHIAKHLIDSCWIVVLLHGQRINAQISLI